MDTINVVCVGLWNHHQSKIQHLMSKLDGMEKYLVAMKQLGHIHIQNKETNQSYHFIFTSPSSPAILGMSFYLYVESELTNDFLARSAMVIKGSCKITHDIILTDGNSEIDLLPKMG